MEWGEGQPHRGRARRGVAGVGLALLVAVVAVVWSTTSAPIANADGPATVAPPGCPALPDHTPTDDGVRVGDVVPPEAAATAVDHARFGGVDVPGAVRDLHGVLSTYQPVAEAALASSGMRVAVLSDGPLEVDLDALDALARTWLERTDLYDDPRMRALVSCYRRRVLDERELAGSTLRIFVPADPRTCFNAARLVDRADGCTALGVTFPRVPGSLRVLGVEVARLRNHATIIVSPGVERHRGADLALARELVHELSHHIDNALGLPPWAGSLTQYEQRAYYVETVVGARVAADPSVLPLAIRYPS